MGKRSKPARSAPLVPAAARPLPRKQKSGNSAHSPSKSLPTAGSSKPAGAQLSSRPKASPVEQTDSRARALPPKKKKATQSKAATPLLPEDTKATLLAAEERIWDPDATAPSSSPELSRALQQANEPLRLELQRGAALRRLRLAFGDATRSHKEKLVGAFERWHFGWLECAAASKGSERLDPLLPLCAAKASAAASTEDRALELELRDAGIETAGAVVAKLRSQAQAEAAALSKEIATGVCKEGVCEKGDQQKRGARSMKPVAQPREAARLAKTGPSHPALEAVEVRPAVSRSAGSAELLQVCCSIATSAAGADKESLVLKISARHHDKLKTMHERARALGMGREGATGADEQQFKRDLVRLLLRYKAIGGSGFQAAIGGAAHAVLRSSFGCSAECFASPLNTRSVPFCSAFLDTDSPFGSLGSFLDFRPSEGNYEANPPFVPRLVLAMASHMDALLGAAEQADAELLFVVVVGSSAAMRRSDAWEALQRLARGRFGRAQWLVPLQHHGYTAGHAHIEKTTEQTRMSSCESTVLVFASSAADRRWPVSPPKEASLRAALRLTLPQKMKRARKAERKVHQQRKSMKKRRPSHGY